MPPRKRVVRADGADMAPAGGAVPTPSSSALPVTTPVQMTAPVNPMSPQLITATLATSPSPADNAAEAFAQLSFATTPMLPAPPSILPAPATSLVASSAAAGNRPTSVHAQHSTHGTRSRPYPPPPGPHTTIPASQRGYCSRQMRCAAYLKDLQKVDPLTRFLSHEEEHVARLRRGAVRVAQERALEHGVGVEHLFKSLLKVLNRANNGQYFRVRSDELEELKISASESRKRAGLSAIATSAGYVSTI